MAGRPKGKQNTYRQDVSSKSICLPKEAWDKLTELGDRQRKTPQKVAAEIILEALSK